MNLSNKPRRQLLSPSLEERQSEQPILLRTCEAEEEEVYGHERERHQTNEGRTQLTTHHPSGRQLLTPSPLQTDEDVHILCSPGLQTCLIQTNVEITAAIEIVRSLEHVHCTANKKKYTTKYTTETQL